MVGPEVVAIEGNMHASSQGSASEWGDLIVSPLNLQCDKRKIGPVSVYQRIVFDFFLPGGEYQRSSAVNLSSHAWSANPY
jgi:hypothetical protein